jgi:hypothetical protein
MIKTGTIIDLGTLDGEEPLYGFVTFANKEYYLVLWGDDDDRIHEYSQKDNQYDIITDVFCDDCVNKNTVDNLEVIKVDSIYECNTSTLHTRS